MPDPSEHGHSVCWRSQGRVVSGEPREETALVLYSQQTRGGRKERGGKGRWLLQPCFLSQRHTDTFDLYLVCQAGRRDVFSKSQPGSLEFLKECVGVKQDFKLKIISNQSG